MKNISKELNNAITENKPLLILAGLFFGYQLYKKSVDDKKKAAYDEALLGGGGSPTAQKVAQYVSRLDTALNPSGYGWLRSMDGTDEDAIFAVFREMRAAGVSYAAVAGLFEEIHGERLTPLLEGELGSEDFNRLAL